MAWQIGKGAVLRAGYGMFYAQDPRQHLLRAARGKRRVPANLHLHQPRSVPVADLPERDLHAAGTAHAGSFRRAR